MRLLAVYEPLVVVSESHEVSERLLLAGPFHGDLPMPGEYPDDEALASVADASLPFGGLPWAECHGRPFITRCGPGKYAILVPVGHGGRVKYDPVVETEVVRLLALSNKAALVAVSVAMQHAHDHGRPDPADLPAWQHLLALIKEEIACSGLKARLRAAREELASVDSWVRSRRRSSAARRRRGAGGDGDDSAHVLDKLDDDNSFDEFGDVGDFGDFDNSDGFDRRGKDVQAKSAMPCSRAASGHRSVVRSSSA